MKDNNADYTNTFIYLMDNKKIKDKIYLTKTFSKINKKINQRILINNVSKKIREKIMTKNNPLVIPRNYKVEEALNCINNENNYELFNDLLDIIKEPYSVKKNTSNYQKIPNKLFEKNYRTFCGT